MKKILKLFILFFSINSLAQEKPNFEAVDSLYREDQFYLGIFYNSLQNRPSGITQGRFTPSFSAGFLRDMPLNKNRNFAIALGFGYSINNYNQNLLSKKVNDKFEYSQINKSVEKDKMILHYIDLPFEIRWRTSTPINQDFWRIYAGLKASYLVYNRTKFIDGDISFIHEDNDDFNKFQLGTYLCIGNNTINFYAYTGLKPIYKNAFLENKKIEISTLNFGLMFYIL